MGLIERLTIQRNKETVKSVNTGNFSIPLDSITPEQFKLIYSVYSPQFGKKYNSAALMKLYNEVGAVNAIINFIAGKIGEIPIKHVRYQNNGKKKELGETDALKVIYNPNLLKTQNSYLSDIAANLLINGNAPVWMNKTPGFEYPSRLELLAPENVFAIPRYSADQYGTPLIGADPRFNELVSYRLFNNGQFIPIKKEEIIYIKMLNPNRTGTDWYYGMSPLYAAIRNIDVLSGLYDLINTITQYRGALGFIKQNRKQNQLDPIIPQEEKDIAEERLLSYGVGKNKKPIFLTPYDLSWQRIDTPISEFMPVELDEKQFGHLCNQFMISDVLFNSHASSTYNNVNGFMVSSYQNCMMPLMSNILNAHSIAFGISKNNEWFEADWSAIAVLQEDEKLKYEALEIRRSYLTNLYNSGLITRNDILSGLDLATHEGDEWNSYKTEPATPDTAGQGGDNQNPPAGN